MLIYTERLTPPYDMSRDHDITGMGCEMCLPGQTQKKNAIVGGIHFYMGYRPGRQGVSPTA